MAKSKETFSKKEKEKKKLKKRQEKEERKEERKANKSSNINNMIAYVDENGNLTSSPPDPKKKIIILEDIQISTPRQSDVPPEPLTGNVIFFNTAKGFGYIRNQKTKEEVFFHSSSLSEPVKERDAVTYDVERTPRGLAAINVTLVK